MQYDMWAMEATDLKWRDGKIVRSEDPLNLEMPFENVEGFITPTASFYVRTHFPIPRIDKKKWRLRVEGEVDRPLDLSFDELVSLGSSDMTVTLACAGTNRHVLAPK